MANFPKMQLTSKGLELLTNVQAGADNLIFTKTALGDGVLSVPVSTLTNLVSIKAEIPISEGKAIGNNTYQIGAFFNNTEITTGFWWREIGVFAKGNNGTEILYCYSNAGDAGDYIPVGSDERIEKYIYQSLAIGNATNVTAQINSSDSFILSAEKGKPSGVAPLGADGKIPSEFISIDTSTFEETVKELNTNLTNHLSATNPHNISKTTVGLANVPNVSTNDQTPTYTEATSLTNLTSGEKLGIAFGKIKKAITDLTSHLADTTKHITATERNNWNKVENVNFKLLKTLDVSLSCTTASNSPGGGYNSITLSGFGNGNTYDEIKFVFNGTISGNYTSGSSAQRTITLSIGGSEIAKVLSYNQGGGAWSTEAFDFIDILFPYKTNSFGNTTSTVLGGGIKLSNNGALSFSGSRIGLNPLQTVVEIKDLSTATGTTSVNGVIKIYGKTRNDV